MADIAAAEGIDLEDGFYGVMDDDAVTKTGFLTSIGNQFGGSITGLRDVSNDAIPVQTETGLTGANAVLNGRLTANFGQTPDERVLTFGRPASFLLDSSVPTPFVRGCIVINAFTGTTWSNTRGGSGRYWQDYVSSPNAETYYGDSSDLAGEALTLNASIIMVGPTADENGDITVRVNGEPGTSITPDSGVTSNPADIIFGARRNNDNTDTGFVFGSSNGDGARLERLCFIPGVSTVDTMERIEGLWAHALGITLATGHPYKDAPPTVEVAGGGGAGRNAISIGLGV
jgi:hypothetical protein